jgi:hypothetical protein
MLRQLNVTPTVRRRSIKTALYQVFSASRLLNNEAAWLLSCLQMLLSSAISLNGTFGNEVTHHWPRSPTTRFQKPKTVFYLRDRDPGGHCIEQESRNDRIILVSRPAIRQPRLFSQGDLQPVADTECQ